MSDTPKFTVVDRRKFRADDDSVSSTEIPSRPASDEASTNEHAAPAPGPRLVEPIQPTVAKSEPSSELSSGPVAVAEAEEDFSDDPQLPPAPSAEEASFQKAAYDQSAERLDDLVRAQNPGAPPQEKIGFEHLVQQLYLSAMMQMGAGTPEGQRPRIDILGARQTIDLLGVVLEKSSGSLTAQETRTLNTVLYELHATFVELTRMISAQPPIPPPPGAKR